VSDSSRQQRLADGPIGDRLARGAQAAKSLSDVLWEALGEELACSRTQRVAELSQRLAEVSHAVAALARTDTRARQPPGETLPQGPEPLVAPRPPQAPAQGSRAERMTQAPAPPQPPVAQRERALQPDAPDEPSLVAILVDELAPDELAPDERLGPPVSSATTVQAPSKIEIRDERREIRDERRDERREAAPREAAPREPERRETAPREAERREAARREESRGEHGPTPWIASIERRLERYERDGLPFAVLLLELADVDRLRHAELPGEVARLTGLVEAALAAELRPADSLTRESPGRYWLLAPETDAAGAKALAARLADGVRRAASHRGAPLRLAAGIAVCPGDSRQASALAAQADIALYAAHAAGRPVAPFDNPAA